MPLEYPYQLVAFLDKEPVIGETVYDAENGWYPQLAVKRRFKLTVDECEEEFIDELRDYLSHVKSFTIETGELTTTERMPVRFIEVMPDKNLLELHNNLINFLNKKIASRYPERDGKNYYPHITAEYDNKQVVNNGAYSGATFKITSVRLLKDVKDENSIAYAKLLLSSNGSEGVL